MSPPSGRAGQLGHKQPVRGRAEAILNHPARIEHACDKSKLAILASAQWPEGKEPEILTPPRRKACHRSAS